MFEFVVATVVVYTVVRVVMLGACAAGWWVWQCGGVQQRVITFFGSKGSGKRGSDRRESEGRFGCGGGGRRRERRKEKRRRWGIGDERA